MTTEADDREVAGAVEEGDSADPLAGVELFDVPDDLQDSSDGGAPAPAEGADPEKGPPAAAPGAKQIRRADGTFGPAVEPVEGEGAEPPAKGQPPEAAPAGAPAAEAPAGEPAAQADADEPELEFSFTADRQQIPIKGSKLTKDWLMIPREYTPDVQRLLSHGVVYQGSFRQRLEESARQVAEAKSEVQENVVRADATLQFFAKLLDDQQKWETEGDGPSPIESWLSDFQQNRVRLEADATLAAAKAYENRKPAGDVRVPGFEDAEDPFIAEQDQEELHNNLSIALTTRIETIARSPELRGLSAAERTRILQSMTAPEEIDRYFKVALEDIPEHKILKGSIVAMDAAIERAFKYQAGLILDARKTASELQRAQAANNRGNGEKIPPTTTVNGPVPGKSKEPPKFKNKQEMDEWFRQEDPLG